MSYLNDYLKFKRKTKKKLTLIERNLIRDKIKKWENENNETNLTKIVHFIFIHYSRETDTPFSLDIEPPYGCEIKDDGSFFFVLEKLPNDLQNTLLNFVSREMMSNVNG
jgi:hypothetical protein